MERSLVGAQIDPDSFVCQPFPEVHDIAHIGQRNGLLALYGLAYTGNQLVQRIVELVNPSLVIALSGREGVDFRGHGHDPCDVAR